MKTSVLAIALSAATLSSVAQNEIDALRYSQLTFGGTARFVSMGGAFGALGADLSGLSFNPAGVAMYRKSELSFTPAIYSQSTSSDYNGTTSLDNKFNFNFGNAGFVLTNKIREDGSIGWINTNFAFGYNRTANFHNRTSISGSNSASSLLDVFVNGANGLPSSDLDPFSSALAFNLYLIDTVPGSPTSYFSAIPAGTKMEQRKSIEATGSMGETYFSFGGNYSNRLYLGATIGLPHLRYDEESTHQEIDTDDTISGFQSFSYGSSLSTRGNGFNVKLGMMYRITDWFRIGGAVHTPSFFAMSDEYGNTIRRVDDNDAVVEPTTKEPSGSYDYRLTTPMKLMGSMGFIVAKKAVIGLDYERVDYASASLNSSPNVFIDENTAVRAKYKAANNIRAGVEWRLDPFSLRAGYALYGNPYSSGVNIDASRSSYSGGFGIREKAYFIDFAYVYTKSAENYYLYDASLVNPAKNTMASSGFLVTLGFRY